MSSSVFDNEWEEGEYSEDYSSDEEEEERRIDLPLAEHCKHMPPPAADAASLDEVLPIGLEELYRRFLAADAFWRRLCTGPESDEFSASAWQERECCHERLLKFTIPVKHFLGPKTTPVTQTHLVRLKDPQTLVLHTSSVSHNVPYADSFTVETKWKACAESTQGTTRTWVKIHWELKWNRSVWVKSLIERNAMEGAKEFLEEWLAAVKEVLRAESTVKEVRNSATTQNTGGGAEVKNNTEGEKEEEEGEEEEDDDDEEEGEEEEEETEREGEGSNDGDATVAHSGSGEESHGNRGQRATQRKGSKRRASEVTAKRNSGPEQKSTEDTTMPWTALALFFFVLSLTVAYPLLHIRSRALESLTASHADLESHSDELLPRLSLCQATLGNLSHSLTLLPGVGLREQWERHWGSLPVPCLEAARTSAALPPSALYAAVAQLWSCLLVVAKAFAAVALGALLVFLPYSVRQSIA